MLQILSTGVQTATAAKKILDFKPPETKLRNYFW
jgi:hypothetical protein